MMTERRRSTDPRSPRRRREDQAAEQAQALQAYVDQLEDLLEHGSKNFRSYRRWANIAFAGLVLAYVFGLYLIQHNADVARDDLAKETTQRARVLADQAKVIASQAAATAEQSKAACMRTRRLFPPLLDGFERTGVLKGADLELYRRTIPKSC
jgi:hypothetical protein